MNQALKTRTLRLLEQEGDGRNAWRLRSELLEIALELACDPDFSTVSVFQRFAVLSKRRGALKQAEDSLKRALDAMQSPVQDALADSGALSVKTELGTVHLARSRWVKQRASKPEILAALRAAGLGDFISEGFNSSRLSAHFREIARELEEAADEQIDLAEALPDELRGVLDFTEKTEARVRRTS